MGELEAFYARRRRVTFVISLASALQAILFGSSVLIEGLLTTFDEPPEPGRRTYAFHGLYAKVLITPVLCFSEPRLPREKRGRRLQPLLLRRGGPELRELPARRDDGMARATRCRRGARLNSAPSPRSAHK